MRPESKALCLSITGYLLCIVPALVASLEYFPLWFSGKDSRQVIGACGLIMIILCCLPLLKTLRNIFRTPSAWKVWAVLALCFGLMKYLADGMFAIACIACPTSIIGAVLFHFADKIKIKAKIIPEEKHERP